MAEEKKKLTKEEKKKQREKKAKDIYKKAKTLSKKKVTLGSVFGAILAVILVITIWGFISNSKPSITTITTESSLERIINLSKLSTFEAIYNGVAEVHDANDPGSIDYYVSYEAKVKAGFDFEKISIKNKKVSLYNL